MTTMTTMTTFDGFGRDLRQAARALRREPAFAVTAVVALALGIGLTTASFSIVWGTLLRGLPFDDAHELVHFERSDGERVDLPVTPHDLMAWREANRTFVGLAAYTEAVVNVERADGTPERVYGSRIDPVAFDLLGAAPARGRMLGPDDDRPEAADVVLLSHGLWQRTFGGRPDVVGREMRLNGAPHTIVGVMPEGFAFPLAEELWLPLRLEPGRYARGEGRLDVFGRLRPGVDLDVARADLERVSASLAAAWPDTHAGVRAVLRSYVDEYVDPEFASMITALLIASLLVLLLSALNVANLLLARSGRRAREIAVRRSLGAGGGRVVRHVLAEAGVLGAGAAALGTGLAWVGVTWFAGRGTRPGTFELAHGDAVPFWWDVRLDPASLAFVLAVTLGTVVLAGLLPALRALRTHPNTLLRSEGRGGSARTSPVSRAVVVAEIALAGGVLAVSGLMGKSMLGLTSVGRGLDTEGVVVGSVGLPDARLAADESAFPTVESRVEFWTRLRTEMLREPGVTEVAVATAVPFLRAPHQPLRIPGRDDEPIDAATAAVDASYFALLGVEAVEGRLFDEGDGAGSEVVVVVNRSFADRHFDAAAVGRVVEVPGAAGDWTPARVVGVVPDLWMDGIQDVEPDGIYRLLAQSPAPNRTGVFDRRELRYASVLVRAADGGAAAPALRERVQALAPGQPVYGITTLDDTLARVGGRYRLYATTYMVFGGVSLAMVLIGLYGLVTYTVGQRRREIGVRVALGASAGSVVAFFLRRAALLVAAGAAGGVVVALWLRNAIGLVLYRVQPDDGGVLIAVMGFLVVTTLVAAGAAALRAAGVDPREAIQAE